MLNTHTHTHTCIEKNYTRILSGHNRIDEVVVQAEQYANLLDKNPSVQYFIQCMARAKNIHGVKGIVTTIKKKSPINYIIVFKLNPLFNVNAALAPESRSFFFFRFIRQTSHFFLVVHVCLRYLCVCVCRLFNFCHQQNYFCK